MGIEIQYDQDISHGGTREGQVTETLLSPADSSLVREPLDQSRGRRRRKSESSIWEIPDGMRGRHKFPHRSHSLSRANPTIFSMDLSNPSISAQATKETAEVSGHIGRPSRGPQEEGKEHNVTARLSTSPGHDLQRSSAQSTSADGSMQMGQRLSSTAHDVDTKFFLALGSVSRPTPPEILLDTKVILFKQYRARNLILPLWVQWRRKSLQLREDRGNLDLLAKHGDRETLLRQAIFSWQASLRSHQQETESENFFAHLGRRAGRARDLFLLTKAFTHWAKSASDEAQRTSIARRHVLRIKYFGSWLEVTAINELKVRRQVIRKFFITWQKRYTRIVAAIANAAIVLESNLVNKMFWVWIWTFYEQRAPFWWATRERRKIFSMWLAMTRASQVEESTATKNYHQALRKRFQIKVVTKLRQHTAREHEALTSSAILISRKVFIHWRHQSVILPALHKLQDKVAIRLERESVRGWLLQARQERRAMALDQLKITREAWAAWTDRLRYQTFRSRTNDRLVFQGLYRWVLKERLILAQRLVDRRVTRIVIQTMTVKLRCAIEREMEYSKLAQYVADHMLTSRMVRKLRSCLEIHLHHYNIAECRSPKVLSRFLNHWTNQVLRVSQLHEWASSAEFYFLTGRTLKIWKEAAVAVKRDRIRKSYKQTRRRYKIVHVSGLLSVWRRRAKIIMDTRGKAVDIHHNKTMTSVLQTFERWKGHTSETMELEPICGQILLRKHFSNMRRAFSTYRLLDIETTSRFRDSTLSLAVKRWGRVALQHRAREFLVAELRERHGKKVLKKIIAHWNQRSSEIQPPVRDWNSHKILDENTIDIVDGIGVRCAPEDSPDINAWVSGTMGANATNSLPVYLSTPKKSSSSKAIGKFSSTTPTASLSTPYEKQLRGRYRRLELAPQETGVKQSRSLYSKNIYKEY